MLRKIPQATHTKKVFLSATSRQIPYCTGHLNQIWQNTLIKAEIENACFYDLRHDFITRVMRNGNASHVVMKQVSHKTDSMLRPYQLVDERDLMELLIETSTLTQDQKTG
jgi:integrase